MKRTTRTRKIRVKDEGINTSKEELRSVRQTVIRWNARGQTTYGAGICCLLTIYTFEW